MLLLALSVLGALIGAGLQRQQTRCEVFQGLDSTVLAILDARGENYHWEGRNLILTTRDPDRLKASLSIAMATLERCQSVHYFNLGNLQTTSTGQGGPYQRLVPSFAENGEFEGAKKVEEEPFWVHDPDHPDVVLSGTRRGQVAYPAICPAYERREIQRISIQVNGLNLVRSQIAPNSFPYFGLPLIGPEVDPFSSVTSLPGFMDTATPKPSLAHTCDAKCVPLPEGIPLLTSP